MKLARPPKCPSGLREFNLRKQQMVFDAMLPYATQVVSYDVLRDGTDTSLADVHSQRYFEGVLDGTVQNGFWDVDPRKVDHAMASCDAMQAAAYAVLTQNDGHPKVGCAPVSGFHHAGYDYGGGYCTFNGLMATALSMKRRGLASNICIIDGDGHYGDGTQDIIDKLCIDYVHHVSLASTEVRTLADALQRVNRAMGRRPYDLVLYQAGMDAVKGDPSGAGYLDHAEVNQRDFEVFRACKETGTPVVWNLAGGYNGAVTYALHTHTLASALLVFYPEQNLLSSAPAGWSGKVE